MMIKRFLLRLKQIIRTGLDNDLLLQRIRNLEEEVEQLKLQIKSEQAIKIDKIIVDKILCEKVETNYKIDSINNENLSGTMNIGTIYPPDVSSVSVEKKHAPSSHTKPSEPEVKITYTP